MVYGSNSIEDIPDYNVLVRCLTEWTATNNQTIDQTSINEGIGGITIGSSVYPTVAAGAADIPAPRFGLVNIRQKHIHGISKDFSATGIAPSTFEVSFFRSAGVEDTPQGLIDRSLNTIMKPVTRRYQVQLMLGMLLQEKLIPTKWMASQLAIEITLERPDACMYSVGAEILLPGVTPTDTTTYKPTYGVGNVNLIPEILQFDSAYDRTFLEGLKAEGVPIKFSSWHSHLFSVNSNNVSLNIQERSRSVKALFAVQRRPTAAYGVDNGATFFDTAADGLSSLQAYQFRLGGRYYPASPVQCSSSIGSGLSNGGAEAYIELQKALNIVGDYRISTGTNITRWAIQPGTFQARTGAGFTVVNGDGMLSEYDYSFELLYTSPTTGKPHYGRVEAADDTVSRQNSFCGSTGSCCFGMAVNLETSNGIEVSGLNGEEQSDFQLIAQWKGVQTCGSISPANPSIQVFSYYDAMLILRENNVADIIY